MDGKTMLYMVEKLLNEPAHASSQLLDERTTFDWFYEAAKRWVMETHCLTGEQEIATVADQAGYTLNGDFMGLFLKHDGSNYFIKINDGSNDYFIPFKPYEDLYYENQTTSVAIPSWFTIRDDRTLDDLVTDTADTADDEVGNKSTLTMSTAVFTDVTPGDPIHNYTDDSHGMVVAVGSDYKTVDTCLFGGTDNEWDLNDIFAIHPRGRLQVILAPPPSTADYTVYVPYLKKPVPVYGHYDVYQFCLDFIDAACRYVAWMYKYRDKEPNFGDAFYKYWLNQMENYVRTSNIMFGYVVSSIYPRIK